VWRDISSAKKAQRCMHDFLNTTSHDARTPLSSIKARAFTCALWCSLR
jgi:K+-sensing histidine kinase KdpD